MKFFFLFITFCASLFAVNFEQSQNTQELNFFKTFDIEYGFFYDTEYKDLKKDYYEFKKDKLINILSNAAIYYPLISDILEQEGLPRELVFVAMAESSFKNKAYSTAKAVGIWQFMPYTAKLYGLRVDEYIDERRDPIKSTYAAVKHLSRLKKQFGKWYLAIMAYNCGGGRLSWAINTVGDDSLAELLKVRPKEEQFRCPGKHSKEKCQALPAETREYIRKVLAMATITQNELTLNALDASHLLNRGASFPMAKVSVGAGTSLERVAAAVNMSEKDLRSFNYSLKYNFVPPYVQSFDIYIPYNKLADFKENFKNTPSDSKYIVYHVKSGDNLSVIGKKFGVGYKVIRDFNNLQKDRLSLNQKLVIPIPSPDMQLASSFERGLKYKVKNGDTLISIAKKYSTSVDKLLKLNNKTEKVIYAGEYLEIKR